MTGSTIHAVTTVTDVAAAAATSGVDPIFVLMGLATLTLIPFTTQWLKQLHIFSSSEMRWILPFLQSVGVAFATAFAYAGNPFSDDGKAILVAIILGGFGGQSAYLISKSVRR